MADEFLTLDIYGNSLFEWARAMFIVVGGLVVGKVVYWMFSRVGKRAAERTKTRLDDLLIDELEEPIVFSIVLAGLWYGVGTLNMTPTAADAIDKGYFVLVVLVAAWIVTRTINSLIDEYLAPLVLESESDLDDQLLPVVRKGLVLTIWLMAVVVALDNAGIDILSILAGLGLGGLAFALAAQDTVANFIGGVTIFVDKPFTLGHRIQVVGYDGVVEQIGFRSTRIRTRYEARLVSIPNAVIARSEIVNVDSEPSRQIYDTYRLSPDTDHARIELALKLLRSAAEADESTAEKVVTGFFRITEYSRDVMLLYWVRGDQSNLKTRTRINLEIVRLFEENDIRLVKGNPTHVKLEKLIL